MPDVPPEMVALMLAAGAAGFAVGHAHARMQRSWADYKATKAAVPGLRKNAWALTRFAFSRWGLATVITIVAVATAFLRTRA